MLDNVTISTIVNIGMYRCACVFVFVFSSYFLLIAIAFNLHAGAYNFISRYSIQ